MKTKIQYRLIRSGRRTTAIRILHNGEVEVRAPFALPTKDIEAFLEQKRGWIEGHQEEMRRRMPPETNARRILFLGQEYTVSEGDVQGLVWQENAFLVPASYTETDIKKAVPGLYKTLAREYIPPRCTETAQAWGLSPSRITVTGAKTKWGSCRGRGNLCFSWQLMAAPPEAVEYVICHELVHMTEMNHSARFWAKLEGYMPDWRERREMLTRAQGWLNAYFE